MKESQDLSITTFNIVFNNQILQLTYDTSFNEYKNKTIDSVIQEVLNKIGPKPQEKTSKDYILICSCGRPYNPSKLLYQAKCTHYFDEDFDKDKNKNEKFLLYEKEQEEKYPKHLSNFEIGNILMKATGAKNLIKIKDLVPNEEPKNIQISENLKNKIKEYNTKKERGSKILLNSYQLKYSEQLYNEIIDIGIPNNKAKAALRMTNNNKEEAILLATDETINWVNKDYLYYDNNEVLSNREFLNLCQGEIKKEFPTIKDEEEISNRVKYVINLINKNKSNNNNQDIDESESNEEEIDSSSEDFVVDDSDSYISSSSMNT